MSNMIDYEKLFREYCKENTLTINLSFVMPERYETANGTFDLTANTLFINKECKLVNIDYSWGEVEFVTRPLRLETKMMADGTNQAAGNYDIDIASDDIDVSETVTLIWSIC